VIPYTHSEAENLIMVVLQPYGGSVHPLSLELAGAADLLASQRGLKTAGVFMGAAVTKSAVSALNKCGLDTVYLYQDKRFAPFNPELHTAALLHCIAARHPSIVLIGASLEGRSIAPLAAVALGTGVTADCTELSLDTAGLLVQTRPAFGGSLMAQIITAEARPQIATVRYGIFGTKVRQAAMGKQTSLIPLRAYPLPAVRTEREELTALSLERGNSVSVLALGGGVRTREDLKLFSRISETMGATLMCSRTLVERGWLSQALQIGISGCCIAPRLLIALGISGSVQFMAGIQRAKTICAVNTDPHAPLLRIADLPLVCDLYQVAALF
jgi:electron transfer flavoprotein alpha subunit